jgi:hypothetical protein
VNKQEFNASSWRSNQGYTKMHVQPTIKICYTLLVDSVESTMMHGLENPKFFLIFVIIFCLSGTESAYISNLGYYYTTLIQLRSSLYQLGIFSPLSQTETSCME